MDFGFTSLVFQQKVYEKFRRLFLDNHQILRTRAYCPDLIDRKQYIAVSQFCYHSVFGKLLLCLSKGSIASNLKCRSILHDRTLTYDRDLNRRFSKPGTRILSTIK